MFTLCALLIFVFILINNADKDIGINSHRRGLHGIYNDRNRSKILSHHEEFILNHRELVDIIFIIDNPSTAADVFKNWRIVAEGYDVIIFGHDHNIINITIPHWMASYDMYMVSDMQNTFEQIEQLQPGKKRGRVKKWFHWLVNQETGFGNHTLIMRNYASWISYKKYIYIVDNEAIPHDKRLIERHISNVKSPPSFFDYR